jgi:hypothetical protein
MRNQLRGGTPRGLVRPTREPASRIQKTGRASFTTEGGIKASVAGRRYLVTVKTASSRWRRDFQRFCQFNGIDAVIAHDTAEDGNYAHDTVYSVIGATEALIRMAELECVECLHFGIDVRPPRCNTSVYPRPRY